MFGKTPLVKWARRGLMLVAGRVLLAALPGRVSGSGTNGIIEVARTLGRKTGRCVGGNPPREAVALAGADPRRLPFSQASLPIIPAYRWSETAARFWRSIQCAGRFKPSGKMVFSFPTALFICS